LYAVDEDSNDSVSYSLLEPSEQVTIDATTGVVTTLQQFNAEINSEFSFTAVATSTDGSSSSKYFTVSIGDVNEFGVSTLVDTNPDSNVVNQMATLGTSVGISVNAEDADVNDSITYSIVGGTGTFSIASSTGEVRTAALLQGSAGDSVEVAIKAESSDGSSEINTFYVNVTGPINGVRDIDGNLNQIDETAAEGSTVGITVYAKDPNTSDVVSYSLSNSANGYFTVDPNTGVVSTTELFVADVESDPNLTFTITAVANSSDGSQSSRTFNLSVIDGNEFPPQYTGPQSLTIAENTPAFTTIATLEATDLDISSTTLHWEILSGNDSGVFSLNSETGELKVTDASVLDGDTNNLFELMVSVSDGEISSAPVDIQIQITNVNDYLVSNQLDVNTAANEILELQPEGSVVGITVNASDYDRGDEVTYSLGESSSGLFNINSVTGEITTASSLDFEVQKLHNIEVTATSSDGSNNVANYQVNVQNVNENPLLLTNNFDTESHYVGVIGEIKVLDPDTGVGTNKLRCIGITDNSL